MEFSQEIMEQRMLSLPDDLQIAMVSNDVAEHVQEVAKKYSLDIEQSGILADVTSYTMLGLIPAKNFVSEFSKRTGLDTAKSTEVAKDIDSQVFDSIRHSLEEMENTGNKSEQDTQNIDRNNLIKDIEEPANSSNSSVNVLNTPTTPLKPLSPSDLVDHLLNAPTASANETVEKAAPTTTPTSTPASAPKSAPTIDPYREPLQ